MRFFFTISLLFSTASKSLADEAKTHDDLKPRTHDAYHRVETACAADVQQLCSIPFPTTSFFLSSSSDGFGDDPFLTWISDPIAPMPDSYYDLNLFMDQLFNSVLSAPSISSSSGVYYSESSLSSPSSTVTLFQYGNEAPNVIIDYGVSVFAAEKQPEEIPLLSHQLQSYGQSILLDTSTAAAADERDSFRTSMARRLTQMDTKTIQYHVQLPFCPKKNACLQKAFEEHKVSSSCADSIGSLEKTFVLEEQESIVQKESIIPEHTTPAFKMTFIYVGILALYGIALLSFCFGNEDEEDEYDIDDEEDLYYAFNDDDDDYEPKKLLPMKKVVYEGVPVQIV